MSPEATCLLGREWAQQGTFRDLAGPQGWALGLSSSSSSHQHRLGRRRWLGSKRPEVVSKSFANCLDKARSCPIAGWSPGAQGKINCSVRCYIILEVS